MSYPKEYPQTFFELKLLRARIGHRASDRYLRKLDRKPTVANPPNPGFSTIIADRRKLVIA
jgi:hypothetical protein